MKDRNHFVLKVKHKGKKQNSERNIQIQRTDVGTCWVNSDLNENKMTGKNPSINDTNVYKG